MSRLKRTLVLRGFGYFEPGRTTAATDGMRQPFCVNTGGGAPLGPSRSHCFRTGGGWMFLIFGFFGGSSHPSIKKSETIRAQDYPMCLGSGRGLPAPFPAYTLRTRLTLSSTSLLRAWSRRLRAPFPSAEDRSVFAARASPGQREGRQGEERSRRSPSRPRSAPPVVLGPVGATPGPGRNVGGAPRIQNSAQCCQYVPL